MKARTQRSMPAVVLACLVLLACSNQPPEPAGRILLGVFYGNQGWEIDRVQQMESWQGKKHAVLNMFTNWCDQTEAMDNLFTRQLLNIWDNRNVPMITWEPFLCTPDQTPADVEVRAANGEYDAYFNTWADRLKVFLSGPDGRYETSDDRRAYIRLGHEMNGDWYPWSAEMGRNSPSDFVRMWKRVKDIVDARGIGSTRVQWVWAVNHDDVGGFRAEQYFPGDDSVDWVGIDGFNWGESQSWSFWRSPSASYDAILGRLRTLTTKPVGVVELATSSSTSSGDSVAAKSQWIADFFNYVIAKDIRMVAWFNEDKEEDWAVLGGGNGDDVYREGEVTYNVYSTYRRAVGGSDFVASNPKNARLLTDVQFAGR